MRRLRASPVETLTLHETFAQHRFHKIPPRVSVVRSHDARAVKPAGTATLPHDERHLRRRAIELADGGKVLVDLPEPVMLGDGDRLVLEDGRQIEIAAAEEELYDIRARDAVHLAELAWHIGNRHLAAAIEPIASSSCATTSSRRCSKASVRRSPKSSSRSRRCAAPIPDMARTITATRMATIIIPTSTGTANVTLTAACLMIRTMATTMPETPARGRAASPDGLPLAGLSGRRLLLQPRARTRRA